MTKYIFTDTNLYEHFPPLSDIDWLSLAKCDCVVLIVPPIVIAELNKHKDGATRARLKKRATSALSKLSEFAAQPKPVDIRNGVTLEFRNREPLVDFNALGLSRDIPDDRLLAAAIEFASEMALDRNSVLVSTADLGLQLKAQSQELVSPLPLPDNIRLPDDVDEETKVIRELQTKLSRLESACPRLRLAPLGNGSYAVLKIGPRLARTEAELEERFAQERARLPFLAESPSNPSYWSLILTLPEKVKDYNKDLEKYFAKFESWIRKRFEISEWRRLTPALSLGIENDGGTPADDIEIEVHLPDGFEVVDVGQIKKYPPQPMPPMTPTERLQQAFSMPAMASFPFDRPYPGTLQPRIPSGPRIAGIKKVNSYLVSIRVDSVLHTKSQRLPDIHLHFNSENDIKPFNFEYSILARNYPERFEGKLNVVIEYEQ